MVLFHLDEGDPWIFKPQLCDNDILLSSMLPSRSTEPGQAVTFQLDRFILQEMHKLTLDSTLWEPEAILQICTVGQKSRHPERTEFLERTILGKSSTALSPHITHPCHPCLQADDISGFDVVACHQQPVFVPDTSL